MIFQSDIIYFLIYERYTKSFYIKTNGFSYHGYERKKWVWNNKQTNKTKHNKIVNMMKVSHSTRGINIKP